MQVFGRLTLLRGTPECFRQSLHLAFLSVWAGVGVLSLAGLSVVTVIIWIYIYIYAHTCIRLVSIVSFGCGSCVSTCLCVCNSVRCFSILLLFSYFSVQDPSGPASFSTHARNNATTSQTSDLSDCSRQFYDWAIHPHITKGHIPQGKLLNTLGYVKFLWWIAQLIHVNKRQTEFQQNLIFFSEKG